VFETVRQHLAAFDEYSVENFHSVLISISICATYKNNLILVRKGLINSQPVWREDYYQSSAPARAHINRESTKPKQVNRKQMGGGGGGGGASVVEQFQFNPMQVLHT
jgi:hypothetical protein